MKYRESCDITRADRGHWNITRCSDGEFVGGFKTLAECKRHVDSFLDRPLYEFSHIDARGRHCYRLTMERNER